MSSDVDVAASGALLADGARVEMLAMLGDGRALPASELAAGAGVSRPTASGHLQKLCDAGWLDVEAHGRHRYFRISNPAVIEALEAMARISPRRETRTLRASLHGDALRAARLCYDHLAGRLGTGLADSMRRDGLLDDGDRGLHLTASGRQRLDVFGLDVDALRRERRQFVRPCLDWSERRHHVAGALGAALATRCFDLGWLRRGDRRVVRVTEAGRDGLRAAFSLEL